MSETKTLCSENPLNNQSHHLRKVKRDEKMLYDISKRFILLKKYLLIKRRKKAEKHQK